MNIISPETTLATVAVLFGIALGILIALYLLATRWPPGPRR